MQIKQTKKKNIQQAVQRNFHGPLIRQRKVSFINERIKEKQKQIVKKMRIKSIINISQIKQINQTRKNSTILHSSFYQKLPKSSNKIISIKKDKTKQNLQIKDKQISSKFSRFSSQDKNSKFDMEQSFYHLQQMKKIQQCFQEDKLQKRLNMFVKQKGRSQLRVYKQDIHKIIINRFGRDRITSLLNTQYIQDFQSMVKTVKDLTTLKKQQVLILSFFIMDQNKDGLITPDDLINLIGVKKQSSSFFNQLIIHDVLKIVQYIDSAKRKGAVVRDIAVNSILRDDRLTLMKYRINKMKERKIKNNDQISKINLLTCRLHQRLYSLQQQPQNIQQKFKQPAKISIEEILNKVIKSNVQKNQMVFGKNQHFAINYQRYSEIFWNQIPKVFLDFLYLFGGIEIAGLKYLSIDLDLPITPNHKQTKTIKQQNKMQKIMKQLDQMSKLNKQLTDLKVRFQSQVL